MIWAYARLGKKSLDLPLRATSSLDFDHGLGGQTKIGREAMLVTAQPHHTGGNEPVEEKLGDLVYAWLAISSSVGEHAVVGRRMTLLIALHNRQALETVGSTDISVVVGLFWIRRCQVKFGKRPTWTSLRRSCNSCIAKLRKVHFQP